MKRKIKFVCKSGKEVVVSSTEGLFYISRLLTELAAKKKYKLTETYEDAYAYLMAEYQRKAQMALGWNAEVGGLLKPNKQEEHTGIYENVEVVNK